MLLVVALVLAGFALYLNHLLDSNVRRAGLLPSASRTAKDPAAGDAVNILLLGSDSRTEDLQDSSRADVIQLVHIDSGRSSAQVIHFPRDLYVDIPGKGKNKINAAFAYGGAPLLVQTLERLLDLRVDHVAQIGFDGFKDLTNTVGGVDVNVEQPTTSGGFTFTKGVNHMSGDQALAFVRERKQLGAGDIDRGKRQQAWIQALLAKSLSRGTLTNPAKLTSMIDDTTSNLVVDDTFSTGAMRSLAISLRGLRGGDVTYLTAPFSGFDSVAGVGSIDVVDQERMASLGTALRTDRMSTYDGRANTPG
ncbi:transcriptional regulator [Luteipulveratus halotolerans]|uniref:Transcriptional regulator n=2 Tax=Luteipulveratus halotolerans TaxID=1631356 RepID=A0A0L6CPE8_9MICO|nr:transcriptional regulator [Luteipulveratus halotolerans]